MGGWRWERRLIRHGVVSRGGTRVLLAGLTITLSLLTPPASSAVAPGPPRVYEKAIALVNGQHARRLRYIGARQPTRCYVGRSRDLPAKVVMIFVASVAGPWTEWFYTTEGREIALLRLGGSDWRADWRDSGPEPRAGLKPAAGNKLGKYFGRRDNCRVSNVGRLSWLGA